MNLVVNDLDMPLIIKVASIPKERIQVYLLMMNILKESNICR
jgi:starch synthase